MKSIKKELSINDQIGVFDLELNYALNGFENTLLPSVKKIAGDLNSIDLKLTQESWETIIKTRSVENLKIEYTERINEQTKSLAKPLRELAISNVSEIFSGIDETVQKLFKDYDLLRTSIVSISIKPNYIKIDGNGLPVLDKRSITEDHIIRLTTPEQVEFYNKLIELKTVWNEAVEMAKSYGIPFNNRSPFLTVDGAMFGQGFVEQSPDGELTINAKTIASIQPQLQTA